MTDDTLRRLTDLAITERRRTATMASILIDEALHARRPSMTAVIPARTLPPPTPREDA